MLELKQLRFFMVSADMGSFKSAAQALYTTQSHVSKIIKALETEMQVELFKRTPGGVELTETGKRVYTQADGILSTTQLLCRLGGEKPGQKLYISSVPNGRLSEIFALFCQMQKEGDVEYQLLEAAVEELIRHVHRRVSEIGFVYISIRRLTGFVRRLESSGFEFVPLKKTGPCLLVGKNSPFYGAGGMEPSALREVKLVQSDKGLSFIRAYSGHSYENCLSECDGQVIVRTNSDSVVAGILDNTDMGTVSCHMQSGHSGRGRLWAVPLIGMENSIYFGYIRRKRDILSPVAKRFTSYLVKMLE